MVYAEALLQADIDFGKLVWQELRANKKFPLNGALWLLKPKSGYWHLLLATPRVDEVGLLEAYRELFDLTSRIPVDSEQLQRIELVSPQERLYQALRAVFEDKPSAEGWRLGGTQFDGIYINDAYLYEIR